MFTRDEETLLREMTAYEPCSPDDLWPVTGLSGEVFDTCWDNLVERGVIREGVGAGVIAAEWIRRAVCGSVR